MVECFPSLSKGLGLIFGIEKKKKKRKKRKRKKKRSHLRGHERSLNGRQLAELSQDLTHSRLTQFLLSSAPQDSPLVFL